jgi:ElaB/YqjD/DUF883 family membrane-anchored ribosome-binding protein
MRHAGEWTISTALNHLLSLRDGDNLRHEQRFVAQERAVEAALYAARTATEKADTATEKRFESVNEFRAQLKDSQGQYISRVEVNALVGNQSLYITRLEMFGWVGVASALGGLIGHFLR